MRQTPGATDGTDGTDNANGADGTDSHTDAEQYGTGREMTSTDSADRPG